MKRKISFLLIFIFGTANQIIKTEELDFRNKILPLLTMMYFTSKSLSIYEHYTLIKIKKGNKIMHAINITKDAIKIILALWVANYIKNFSKTGFIKSSFFMTISFIKFWFKFLSHSIGWNKTY